MLVSPFGVVLLAVYYCTTPKVGLYFLFPQSCGNNALCVCSHPTPTMELQPLSEAAYREFFYEREHYNYFCDDPDIGPCVLSVKKENGDSYDYR